MTSSPRATFFAALPAGAGVLLAFFIWHWFSIAPVWSVLVEGAVGVVIASFAVAWAWRVSRRAGRFGSPSGGLAFGAVFAGALLVGEVFGLARGPRPDPVTFSEIMAELPFALVPVVAIALAGWWIGKGWRGALSYALAGLPLLVYLGGVVVQRGGVGLGGSLFLLLFPTFLAAGVIMGALVPRFERSAGSSG